MKERIRKKMTEYIESILAKEIINKEEYLSLSSELARIRDEEATQKWEERKDEQLKVLFDTFMK